VDTSVNHRIPIKWFLGNFGYIVDSVGNAEEALTVFDAVMHDLVVTDFTFPGMTGKEVAHVIKLRSPSTPVVLYSRQTPADLSGFDAVVQKPKGMPVERQLLKLKETLDQLLGPAR
jgi:CheY-like chemotaxis protein